ncbi:neuronal acetylcholine receptor subunit eat-2-like [Ostrinia nubilalis]|uniref:neuronal acetylcholine receptor subunit eat-2-like n=1 Tax=Ostrinia nubilalis TaxID=29057 RepID=UPI0030824261
MAWLTHILFLSLFYAFKCDCVISHQPLEEAWDKKLHIDLKAGYKWYENPDQCNKTEVKMKIIMNSFNLDSENGILTLVGIMIAAWTDERLTWNTSDYGDITETYFEKLEYWAPFIDLNNRHEDGENWVFYDLCRVESTGFVVCAPKFVDYAQCATTMVDWPYDTQTCTLEYKIDKLQKNINLLPKGKQAVQIIGDEVGPEFTIVDYHQISNTSDEIQLRVTFVLNRNGESLAAVIIFPSILISILTVCSLIMDLNDKNRVLMILFSIYLHFFFLLEIEWNIPKHSAEPPTIVWFYRSSLIMTLFLMTASVMMGKWNTSVSTPPLWVIYLNSKVLKSSAKYLIWPRWASIDSLTLDDVQVKDVDVWKAFTNIVNSVCIFITVAVYAIMIPVCVPMQYKHAPLLRNSTG